MKPNPFKKYHGFVKGSVLNFMAFRSEIVGWVMQDILTIFVLLFLWLAIFIEKSSQDATLFADTIINDYTYLKMTYYLIMVLITGQWVNNTSSFDIVADDIRDGNVSISLTKPVSYRGRCFASTLGNVLGNLIVFALPLLIAAVLIYTLAFQAPLPHWYNVIFYFIMGFFAIVIMDSFDFLIAQLGFLTNSFFGILIIKSTIVSFLAGGMIPFSFFPSWAQIILEYLPFSVIASAPVNIFLNNYSINQTLIHLALGAGWAVFIYLISVFANHKMIKHCEAVGG